MCLHKHLSSIITETGNTKITTRLFCYCLSAPSFLGRPILDGIEPGISGYIPHRRHNAFNRR